MWANPQLTVYLFKFPKEILNAVLHFLCSVNNKSRVQNGNKVTVIIIPMMLTLKKIIWLYPVHCSTNLKECVIRFGMDGIVI